MSNFEELRENEALVVLTHAEAVLMKRIKEMRDGKPKYAASERLTEIRAAQKLLKQYDKGGVVISNIV
jgi:hypothetical protein